jgi:UDP-glucose 4-epimerase
MKILVTGCSGYIGSCLSGLLKKKKNVYFLDKDKPKNFVKLKKNFYKCNLNDIQKLEKIVKKIKPEIIVHLAAKSTVNEKIKKNSYMHNNADATKNLLKVMNKFKVDKIIFSSTAAVYDKSKNYLKETNLLKPISNYGKSKLISEQLIQKNKRIKYVILRFFNVAGCSIKEKIGEFHNPETHLIPVSVFKAISNKTINIFGNNYKTKDGTCVRDYIHVNDICSVILKSTIYLKKNKSTTINVGSGQGISNNDVLKNLNELIQSKIKIKYLKKRKGDQPFLVCNINKVKKILKWSPKNSSIKKILSDEIVWTKYLISKKIYRKYLSVQR